MRKGILSDDEITSIRSMKIYWDEVKERDNQDVLYTETVMIVEKLGPRILDIIGEYINEVEED